MKAASRPEARPAPGPPRDPRAPPPHPPPPPPPPPPPRDPSPRDPSPRPPRPPSPRPPRDPGAPRANRPLLRRPARVPGPRQRPRALAPRRPLGRGGREGHLGRGRHLGAEHLLLGLPLKQRLELLLLDRLALDQDLRQLLERVAVGGEDLLGLHVRGLDHPPDLIIDLARDLIGVVGLGRELAPQERLPVIVPEHPRPQLLRHPEAHHHLLGGGGHLLQVVGGAGGHLAEDDLLRRPAAQGHRHHV